MKFNKIVLIGCGMVGISFLYSAITKNLAQNYVLIDVNRDIADGNAWDLEDVNGNLDQPFNNLKVGNYEDCDDADIIVITAGKAQKPGQTRLELLKENALIMKQISLQIKKSKFNGIVIIASNPVDIMSYVCQKYLALPPEKIIGSGTSLETARLKWTLSKTFKVPINQIETYVIGEHGDSAVPVFSHTKINGQPVETLAQKYHVNLRQIHHHIVNKAYDIIKKKQATYYGIGTALTKIITVIAHNHQQKMLVSAYVDNYYGAKKLYIGVLVTLGKNGIEKIHHLPLNMQEKNQLLKSAQILRSNIDEIANL